MESLDLQDRTRIGAMNPFLQRKPKRQRTGAVQDLAEARKHVALACVLECGSPLPLSDERIVESLNLQDWTPIGAMNRSEEHGCVRCTSADWKVGVTEVNGKSPETSSSTRSHQTAKQPSLSQNREPRYGFIFPIGFQLTEPSK